MKTLWTSIMMLALFTLLTGVAYPLVITVFAQTAFPEEANGSLIYDGYERQKTLGSSLIGQAFTSPKYFHGRPSAGGYDASNSGGSNFALTNQKLQDLIQQRIADIRKENSLSADASIPADLVTASASGLDPNISVESAALQVRRVAKARNLSEQAVTKAVEQNTQSPFLGIFGSPVVNVLPLNIALDTLRP